MIKRIILSLFLVVTSVYSANAYQLLSSKELGKDDARNQTVVVKCTTDTGKTSNQTCTLRRYAVVGKHGKIYAPHQRNILIGAVRRPLAVAQKG